MGERGQIKIGEVYLYTHWRGHEIKEILQEALRKKWRWDDEEYLARIIFEVMIGDKRGTETGFGIGTIEHTDLNYDLLKVDVRNKKVIEGKREWGFEDFVRQKFKSVY